MTAYFGAQMLHEATKAMAKAAERLGDEWSLEAIQRVSKYSFCFVLIQEAMLLVLIFMWPGWFQYFEIAFIFHTFIFFLFRIYGRSIIFAVRRRLKYITEPTREEWDEKEAHAVVEFHSFMLSRFVSLPVTMALIFWTCHLTVWVAYHQGRGQNPLLFSLAISVFIIGLCDEFANRRARDIGEKQKRKFKNEQD